MTLIHSYIPTIPTIEVFLVENNAQLQSYNRFKDHILPPIDGAIAKTIHLVHDRTGDEAIVVLYPTLLSDDAFSASCTLVHEAVHCWDFISNTYGYGSDTELRAYAIESIFRNLYNTYGQLTKAKRKEKKSAKRT